MKVNIKGINKTVNRIKKSIENNVVKDYANAVKDEIVDNLKKSKDTGKLSDSFKVSIHSSTRASITSDAPYAQIQDKGGKITLTEKMRKKMWALYYSTKDEMYKAIALTKKSFVLIKAKHYTRVNLLKISKRINNKIKIKIKNNFKRR